MPTMCAGGWMRCVGLALVFLVFLAGAAPVKAQSSSADLGPDEFRAALLSKLPRFVTWPDSALGPKDTELVIVLLGGTSFSRLLEELVKDLRVGDRPVVVRIADSIEDLPRCQVLFIPASRTEEMSRIPAARRVGLLTVGEEDGFLRAGGVFNLGIRDRKLAVHLRNARAAGLELQSRLLRIVEVER